MTWTTRLLAILLGLLAASAQAEAGRQTTASGQRDPSTSATQYSAWFGTFSWNNVISARNMVMPCTGELTNFVVDLENAPDNGAGTQSFQFTVMVDSVASALDVTISEADTSETDSDVVSVTAGQQVMFRSIPSNTPTAGYASPRMTIECDGDVVMLSGGISGSVTDATLYLPFGIIVGDAEATEADIMSIVPFSGTVTALYATLVSPAGAGETRTLTVMHNGSATSMVAAMSGAVQVDDSDTTNTFTVSAGDTLTLRNTTTGAATNTQVYFGISIVADVPGRFGVGTTNTTTLATSGTNYGRLTGGGTAAVRTDAVQHVVAFQGTGFYVDIDGDPDNGAGTQSYAFTVYIGASGTALTCAITEPDTDCNITGQDVAFADGDLVSVETVSTNTPTARRYRWSVQGYNRREAKTF